MKVEIETDELIDEILEITRGCDKPRGGLDISSQIERKLKEAFEARKKGRDS